MFFIINNTLNIDNLMILGAEPVPCQINQLQAINNQWRLWKSKMISLVILKKYKLILELTFQKGDHFKHVRFARVVHEYASRAAERSRQSHFIKKQF